LFYKDCAESQSVDYAFATKFVIVTAELMAMGLMTSAGNAVPDFELAPLTTNVPEQDNL
jgi:hypothetical protein